MLAEAKTAFEAIRIADAAEAYRYMMKMSGASEEAQREASGLKLRAERRAGELLKKLPETRGQHKKSDGETFPTYAEQGIDKRVAARCQKIASIPEERFEEFLSVADEITTAGAIKIAREIDRFSGIEESPQIPTGTFQVVYADPPWEYRNSGFAMSAAQQYPTMATEDICAMELPKTSDDAVLFLWTTNPLLEDAFKVINAWGFEYKTNMVWVKDNHTAGFYVFGKHELLLIAVKGSMLPKDKPKSVITGDNAKHSKKPEHVYETIEQMYPGCAYVELFARNERDGWSSWGNQL